MRITYIGHSGFAAEWEDIVCLFDFAEGELPRIGADRRLFVFVSHVHSDHFSPEIFHSFDGVARKTFILSDDIPADTEREKGLTVLRMGPDRRRGLGVHAGLHRLRCGLGGQLCRQDDLPRGRSE